MCMKASCSNCGKTTWVGCSNHLHTLFAEIPEDEWCTCEPKFEKDGKEYPPKKQ